ncbi:MAG: hypothetical protein ABH844_03065 [Candidatus Omnitrophota bacterium]
MPEAAGSLSSDVKKELQLGNSNPSKKAVPVQRKTNVTFNAGKYKFIIAIVIFFLAGTIFSCVNLKDTMNVLIDTRTAKYEKTVNVGNRPVKVFFKDRTEYISGLEDAIDNILTILPQEHTEGIKKIVISPRPLADGKDYFTEYSALYFHSTWWNRILHSHTDVLMRKVETTNMFTGNLIHENFHEVYGKLTKEEKSLWKSLHHESLSKNEFASNYAMKNDEEDFAETSRVYVQNSIELLLKANGKLKDKAAFIAHLFMKPNKKGKIQVSIYRPSLDYIHKDSEVTFITPEKILLELPGVSNAENVKFSCLKKAIDEYVKGVDKSIYLSELFSDNEIGLVCDWFEARYRWNTWSLGFIKPLSLEECSKLVVLLNRLFNEIQEENIISKNLKFYVGKKEFYGLLDTELFLEDIGRFKEGVNTVNMFAKKYPNIEIEIGPWVLGQYDIATILENIEDAWKEYDCDHTMKTEIDLDCLDLYSERIEGVGPMGAPGLSTRILNIRIGNFSSFTDLDEVNEKVLRMIPGTDRFKKLVKELVRKNVKPIDKPECGIKPSRAGQLKTNKSIPGNLIGKLFSDRQGKEQIKEGIVAKEEIGWRVFYDDSDHILYTRDGKEARVRLTTDTKEIDGQTIRIIEDNENIRGFGNAEGVQYLTRDLLDEKVARYHEKQESYYADNPEKLPIVSLNNKQVRLNAHTFLRGCGKDVRNAYETLRIDGENPDDAPLKKLITLLNQKMTKREVTTEEFALIQHNVDQDSKGKSRLHGCQDEVFGEKPNEQLTVSMRDEQRVREDRVKEIGKTLSSVFGRVRFPEKKTIILMPRPRDEVLFGEVMKAWKWARTRAADEYNMGNILVRFYNEKNRQDVLKKTQSDLEKDSDAFAMMYAREDMYERITKDIKAFSFEIAQRIRCVKERIDSGELSLTMIGTHVILAQGLIDLVRNDYEYDESRRFLIDSIANLLFYLTGGDEDVYKKFKDRPESIFEKHFLLRIKPFSEEIEQHLLAVEEVAKSL